MLLSTELHKIKRHLTITSCQDVESIMMPLLRQHGITFFNFYREYYDGTVIRLSSDAIWAERYFAKGYVNIPAKVPRAYLTKPFNYFIWLTEDCPAMLTDSAMNFDIANGISLAEKSDHFIEFYGFASTRNNRAIVNFYINNLELLQHYCCYFKQQAACLIAQAERSKIMIINTDAQTNIPVLSELSPRQLDCARHLLEGKKYKEIAFALNLSPRTVETHIEHLKLKLACRTQAELAVKLMQVINYEQSIMSSNRTTSSI